MDYAGKTIKSIEVHGRGAWEGCCGEITFTDGTVLVLDDNTEIDERL